MPTPDACSHHEWVERTTEANAKAIGEIRKSLEDGTKTMMELKGDVGVVKKLVWFAVLAVLGLFINGVSDRVWPKSAAPTEASVVAHADAERAAANADRAHADALRAATLLQTVSPNAPRENKGGGE